ncbi:MAG: phage portal protein [Peptococcaceae bacterium]|nr:phage portal protein [Peptococcaceae bacterium]
MAFRFFDWLVGKTATQESTGTSMDYRVFIELAQEYSLRQLAFFTCVNMIANALGKCEFKTYWGGEEIKAREYYTWNVEPNPNQNSTAFLHKMVAKLYTENEALIIASEADGIQYLSVADSFTKLHTYPVQENVYQNVIVGDVSYRKKFYESDVLHLTLNNDDVKKVLDAMYDTYSRMISAAQKAFGYDFGQHWKVHLDSTPQGDESFSKNFAKMMENQIKPFLQSENAILPEYNGYDFQNMAPQGRGTSRDIKAMYDDIFEFTAKAFNIPKILQSGEVAGMTDVMNWWLTICIDPLCDQLQEEINRKRYGYTEWKRGNYLRIDTSSLIHFDMFAQANNVDKLVSSGVFTVNMILQAAGIPPIDEEWADEHFITKNYAPIAEVLKSVQGGETK